MPRKAAAVQVQAQLPMFNTEPGTSSGANTTRRLHAAVSERRSEQDRDRASRSGFFFTIPVKTVNELNQRMRSTRHAWARLAARAEQQKIATEDCAAYACGTQYAAHGIAPTFPITVQLTRLAPSGGLDPADGLPSSMKYVIDALCAYMGVDDGPKETRVKFLPVLQEKSAEYGVRVEIRWGEPR